MARFSRILFLALALLASPAITMAHTGIGATHGFAHGFAHPFSGLDHIAAMVLVGALGWQAGGAARWLLPVTFILFMAAGGALGIGGIDLPLVEIGIAASIIVLGLTVSLSFRSPLLPAIVLAAAGAIFHGHAHGLEMPGTAVALSYALGFLSATALLHLGGLGAGLQLTRLGERSGMPLLRAAGGISALLGLGILTGAV
ncbi:HupE/UreJ family protein [Mesorhizobium sp. YR577]|uniref:HupE/UreJ family protein n=1 Tax=Mesorhizobium sp. YR577 TaxID=1884373 RepID=UPI0008F36627|nr:HupE/UreJ family protein [Mesorhizobium sp. YR577]SFU18976.1 urease accessory protein [Mesorhizobium sp. YR577]